MTEIAFAPPAWRAPRGYFDAFVHPFVVGGRTRFAVAQRDTEEDVTTYTWPVAYSKERRRVAFAPEGCEYTYDTKPQALKAARRIFRR